jgi:hypothetical protein
MAQNKTRKTQASVAEFLDAIDDEARRKDAKALDTLMREVTGEKPAMWGPAIVGYGRHTLTYDSGRVVDWMRVGFSPRKAALTLYLTCDIAAHAGLTARLGKHSTGKGCLYIKNLADVDHAVLRKLIATCLPA